jgi:hypothetical protein
MSCDKSQWIDDRAKVAHPKDNHQKIYAMLQGYLDESGIQDGAPVCLVAGYFGGQGQWRKVGQSWERILVQYGVPEFHASRFWAFKAGAERVGPYKGWSKDKAEQFLYELVEVINRHKIHPVSTVLVVDAFQRLTYNQRRFLTGGALNNGRFVTSGCPSKPYYLPFQTVILDIARHAPIGGKAHFAFDLNKQFKGYALELFGLVKGLVEHPVHDRIGEISFPTGLEAVQLQTADLLCYLNYQFAQKKLANHAEKPDFLLRRILQGMLDENDFPFLDDKGLSTLLEGINLPT